MTSDDVILCSGCSCALDIAISTLADDGQNILVPRPGFPLYTTLSAGLGIQTREYDLLPDHDWMVDLGHMESLIDHNTAAIIVNSPSNPCGSVFSPAHLREILDIAERHKVPIIGEISLGFDQLSLIEFDSRRDLRQLCVSWGDLRADCLPNHHGAYKHKCGLPFPFQLKHLPRCLSCPVADSPKGSWCQDGGWAGSSSMTEDT